MGAEPPPVPPSPADRKMVVNALNSGAKTFMADFEGSVKLTRYSLTSLMLLKAWLITQFEKTNLLFRLAFNIRCYGLLNLDD
jgi:hypothetical protein